MNAQRNGYHDRTEHTHAAVWCRWCERVHTGDDHDVRATLEDRGTWRGTVAYVWSERCAEYHLQTFTLADALREDTVGRIQRARILGVQRARDIARWKDRTRQPSRAIAVSSVWGSRNPDSGIAHAARRSRVTALARGGFGI